MKSRRSGFAAGAILSLWGLAGVAWAQLDPAMMSGLARPDGTIAAGTVTVRLLRGHDFDHPIVRHDVALLLFAPDGTVVRRDAMTDGTNGRATFAELPETPGLELRAVAIVDGKALFSHPFELNAQAGIATMLVALPPGETPASMKAAPPMPGMQMTPPEPGAEPIAAGRPGDVGVVVREHGVAKSGVAVSLARLDAGGASSTSAPVSSNEQGIAFFRGLQPDALYVATAGYSGGSFRSVPFTPSAGGAVALPLDVETRTQDPSALVVGDEIAVDTDDDELDVFERLELANRGTTTYQTPPGGLLLPLPAGFHDADLADDAKAVAEVAETQGVRFRGTLEPLDPQGKNLVEIGVGFRLPYGNASRFRLEQAVPPGITGVIGVAMARDSGAIATCESTLARLVASPPSLCQHAFGLEADQVPGGPEPKFSVVAETDRPGHEMVLENIAARAGGTLEVTLNGLPTRDRMPRDVAAAIAGMIVVVGVLLAVFAPRPTDRHAELEEERRKLADELIALESRPASDDQTRRRATLEARLEKVLRALDGDMIAESQVRAAP